MHKQRETFDKKQVLDLYTKEIFSHQAINIDMISSYLCHKDGNMSFLWQPNIVNVTVNFFHQKILFPNQPEFLFKKK